ncbi:UNVERIFIED_CONTAM: hypothetical protein Sindi_0917500, partial [Sesamum indicum]
MSDDLSENCRTTAIAEYDGTTDPQEHLSRIENATLLHKCMDMIKCLFSSPPLSGSTSKGSTQPTLEVLFATQEVKTSAFAQGLFGGDFLRSLAKNSISKFDTLLARATKIHQYDGCPSLQEGDPWGKEDETKEEPPLRNRE